MYNDLKYGKISEICGINGYFAGKNREKNAPVAPKKKVNSHIFLWRGEKNSTFSKNILP